AYHSDGLMGVGAVNPVKLTVAAWYWGAYLGEEGLKKGIRVKISSYTRMHMNSDPTRAKVTGHYLNSVLAKREALVAGYDEAVLLDQQGYVAEATGENLFLVRDGTLYTPPAAAWSLATWSGSRRPRRPQKAGACRRRRGGMPRDPRRLRMRVRQPRTVAVRPTSGSLE